MINKTKSMILVISALVCTMQLSACGQKGALYLPNEKSKNAKQQTVTDKKTSVPASQEY